MGEDRVIVHRRAARYVGKLPADEKARLKERLSQLLENPSQMSGAKAMHGEWQGYQRLRVGSLRIVYWVDEDRHLVFVDYIGPRGDVYK